MQIEIWLGKKQQLGSIKTKISLALLVLAGLSGGARADENDQLWLTGTVKWKAAEQVMLKAGQQARFRDDDNYYQRTELGAGYTFSKYWSISASYWYVRAKDRSGQWQEVDGALLNPVNRLYGLGMELKSRIRISHFIPRNDVEALTDIRPKFILLPQKGFTGWNFKPYVMDEIMYNLDHGTLYRNRASLGLKAKPLKRLALDFFVMSERTEKTNGWVENINAGMEVLLLF